MKKRLVFASALLCTVSALPCSAQTGVAYSPVSGAIPQSDASNAKAVAKQWGVLAQLAGTTWTEGADQVVDYRWEVPGELMFITTRGLWGSWQTAVFPSADGRALSARTRYTDSKLTLDGAMSLSSDGYTLLNPDERHSCRQAKNSITCRSESLVPKNRWRVERTRNFSPSNVAAGQALLASISTVYPRCAPSQSSQELGPLKEMANKVWQQADGRGFLRIFDWSNKNPSISLAMLDSGSIPQSLFNFLDPVGIDVWGNPGIIATYSKPSIENPSYGTATVTLRVTKYCEAQIGSDTLVNSFVLSSDGHSALSRDLEYDSSQGWHEKGRKVFRSLTPGAIGQAEWGALSKLPGRIYYPYGVEDTMAFEWLTPSKMLLTSTYGGQWDRPYKFNNYCVMDAPEPGKNSTVCVGFAESGAPIRIEFSNITTNEFHMAKSAFRLGSENRVIIASGNSKGYANLGYLHNGTWYSFITQSIASNNYQIKKIRMAERQQKRRQDDARLESVFALIGSVSTTLSQINQAYSQSYNRPVYQRSISAPSLPGGYASSMGSTSYVSASAGNGTVMFSPAEVDAFMADRRAAVGTPFRDEPAPLNLPSPTQGLTEAQRRSASGASSSGPGSSVSSPSSGNGQRNAATQGNAESSPSGGAASGGVSSRTAITVGGDDPAERQRIAAQEAARQSSLADDPARIAKARAADAAAKAEYERASAEVAKKDAARRAEIKQCAAAGIVLSMCGVVTDNSKNTGRAKPE